jgi:predicted Zn-dependent protease
MHTRTYIALALALLLMMAGCATNPVTGNKDFVLIGEERELALGDQTHPNVIQMYDGEYRDPELVRYLGTIVKRLHKVSHRQDMPVDFTILNTSIVNAFATPGHVYATRGFLAKLENEAQFASVMGHEWAHVAARHTARQMSSGILGQLALGVGSSMLGDSGAAQIATQITCVGITMLGLQYSRSQEHQADRVGTYYMALAGWNPEQSIRMMEILGSLNTHKPGMLDKYLSTHPQHEDRIADIRRVIQEKDLERRYIQGDGVFADRWKRRLAGLIREHEKFETYDEGTEALAKDEFRSALSLAEKAIRESPDTAQFHRLKADALMGLDRIQDAQKAYQKSLSLYPRYEPAALGLARIDLVTGDYRSAEQRFAEVTHDWPGSVNASYGLGLARYHQEKFEEAIAPLEAVASATARQPVAEVLYVLGSSYDRVGRAADALAAYDAAVQTGSLSGDRKQRAMDRIQKLTALLTPPEAEGEQE